MAGWMRSLLRRWLAPAPHHWEARQALREQRHEPRPRPRGPRSWTEHAAALRKEK